MDIVEDVEAELQEFIRLARLELFEEASEWFKNCLFSHQTMFPVLVEHLDMLLQAGRYQDVVSILDTKTQEEPGKNLAVHDETNRNGTSQLLASMKTLAKARRKMEQKDSLLAALEDYRRYLETNWPRDTSQDPSAILIRLVEVYLGIVMAALEFHLITEQESVRYTNPPLTTEGAPKWSGFCAWYTHLMKKGYHWEAQRIQSILLPTVTPEEAAKTFIETGPLKVVEDTKEAKEFDESFVLSMLVMYNTICGHLLKTAESQPHFAHLASTYLDISRSLKAELSRNSTLDIIDKGRPLERVDELERKLEQTKQATAEAQTSNAKPPDPKSTRILNDSDGLVNLRNFTLEVERIATDRDKSVPIVLVPGFTGWGAPLFGAINYFGGVINIPELLADRGYTVIVAPVSPISSNWERACELYRQLTFGKFSTINSTANSIDEVYDVDIDYGTYFDADPARAPERTSTEHRRRAILFSKSSNFHHWKWDRSHKVHFICHSQGGNTVRYLISLMALGAGNLHPTYFGEVGRDNWTISVTTLGTPHRGTTIIDTIESFLSRSRKQAVGLVARLFATASFYPPEKRAYDLQLDHWGIRRNSGETFQDMLIRMEKDNGPVWKWLNSDNNSLYDNSIEGVHNPSLHIIETSEHIYYFSLSFHATDPFPRAWPAWGQAAINSFPIHIRSYVERVIGNIPIAGWLMEKIINACTYLGWEFITTETDFRSFGQWVTEAVISRILQERGYQLVLPNPGKYIPRKDVIPILLLTVYAMGGQELTRAQKDLLGPDLGDWYQNDGIVNTESMPGPQGCVRSINSLPDFDFRSPEKRGVYWHLGVNDRMDHADEIGVFIEEDTVRFRVPCRWRPLLMLK
ncbi:uncharacterized protein B0J16DRAFT_322512 [Fusarium flagelliforme]|uniref:uncharacterized protein n=1 Tax=Fusarium flagelliforme TaxID=2675880 RepID=UPI001E8D7E85|nr:uncharacterized protein B0J16DRAFT_322512 [Fusarium flagelliforme]KAH7179024.1 hypothetical protein B0J16DRAFT_322512 [Fusarium flagelliforme]